MLAASVAVPFGVIGCFIVHYLVRRIRHRLYLINEVVATEPSSLGCF